MIEIWRLCEIRDRKSASSSHCSELEIWVEICSKNLRLLLKAFTPKRKKYNGTNKRSYRVTMGRALVWMLARLLNCGPAGNIHRFFSVSCPMPLLPVQEIHMLSDNDCGILLYLAYILQLKFPLNNTILSSVPTKTITGSSREKQTCLRAKIEIKWRKSFRRRLSTYKRAVTFVFTLG